MARVAPFAFHARNDHRSISPLRDHSDNRHRIDHRESDAVFQPRQVGAFAPSVLTPLAGVGAGVGL